MTTFNVLDDTGATRGTISVPSSESDSLIKCWSGKFEAAKPAGGPNAMAKTLMANRTKVNKAALLSGS